MGPASSEQQIVNVAKRLTESARGNPAGVAIVEPLGRRKKGSKKQGPRKYRQCSFAELDEDSSRIATALQAIGLKPEMRIALMVRPGIDFISLVFALFKAGAITILIDPGMGRKNLVRCLEEAEPEGFIGIPMAQAVRLVCRRRFPKARLNVTVGRRWFWGGPTLKQLRQHYSADNYQQITSRAEDPAAIIFTTGSTGPPKGVLYRHGNFDQQVTEIRDLYDIQPGEIDLPGFPLFALFNCAMGVTTIIPDMDFTRPAEVDPENIIEAVRDWKVTQAFGSPALWNSVSIYCQKHDEKLPTLKRILTAGAPAPPHMLARMKEIISADGDIYTPYGATESLPVASISASEVLGETAAATERGEGTCVGRSFPGINWKVIRINDGPLTTIQQTEELPQGKIGELIVRGAVVTTEYVTRVEANALHKISDGQTFWHRMGDVGYLDKQDRFWFCGRKTHRLLTVNGPMYTIPCEAIINRDERVYRSALVGIGELGNQQPVIIAELWPQHQPASPQVEQNIKQELLAAAKSHPLTEHVCEVLLHPSLPVDIRHNAKIFREKLAPWAAEQLKAEE